VLTALSIPMLAATPFPPRYKSALLLRKANADWDQDVAYLRGLYQQIAAEWQTMEDRDGLYQAIEPKLRELLLMLRSIADAAPDTQNALRDFETAAEFQQNSNIEMANQYLWYALTKVHKQLQGYAKMGSSKLAYGYDISGEVHEQGGTSGQQRHQWDSSSSPKNDHTQNNPAAMSFDAEAESDYPELAKFKHKRVHWPPRTR
jgi:hypothetical protein